LAAVLSVAVLSGAPPAAHATTPNEYFTARVYQDYMFRPPTADEYTWWNAYLVSGSRQTMVTSILEGDAFQYFWIAGVHSYYLGYFDSMHGDVAPQVSALASSNDYVATEVSVLSSGRYFTSVGATNTLFVTELFRDVLLREPDPAGLSYWVGRLNAATSTRAQVATTLIRSSEGAARRVNGTAGQPSCSATVLADEVSLAAGSYCIVHDRLADSSGYNYWTGQLTGSGQLPGLWASLSGSTEYFNGAQP
jgi:hypothetical protein